MPDIDLTGEIGWEVEQTEVAAQFKAIDPEKDIEITLSTNGGSVFQGVKIGHLIRDHKGKTTVTVSAAALSMGSHILQNADVRKVHDDTAFMMHNPWMHTAGDHIELQKDVDMLKSLAGMLSTVYAKKSGQEKPEVRTMMDNTTWLFGQEIIDAGFADEVIETENPESKEDAIAFAKLQYKECLAKLKVFEAAFDDHKKIAAMLRDPAASNVTPKPAKTPVNSTHSTGKPMNEAEFLAFLATNPEAKTFYDSLMAYIKDVAEASTGPDLTAMSLPDVLALAPQATTEHETALVEARTEVEGDQITAEQVNKIFTVCTDSQYAHLQAAGGKVLTGAKSYDSFEDMVAAADQQIVLMKQAGLFKEQPPATPAGGADPADDTSLKSPAIQANIKKHRQQLGMEA